MKKHIAIALMFVSSIAHAEYQLYAVDSVGNTQYQRGSLSVRDNNRIYSTDKVGNTLYNKPSYRIVNNKIYATDKVGNTLYNKPSAVIKK